MAFRPHPESAPGDFYVINDECLACGAPHVVAPDLIGWASGGRYHHCIWKRQPKTPAEFEQAFAAFDVSEVGCYRYAGSDPAVMKRIGLEFCDQAPVRERAHVQPTSDHDPTRKRYWWSLRWPTRR